MDVQRGYAENLYHKIARDKCKEFFTFILHDLEVCTSSHFVILADQDVAG